MMPTLLRQTGQAAQKQPRGLMFLGTILMIAFAGSVAGITVLYVASTQARIGEFHRTHAAAEAAAEAGLVWALNQLQSTPTLNFTAASDVTIGTYSVDITIDPCPPTCFPATRRLQARVTY